MVKTGDLAGTIHYLKTEEQTAGRLPNDRCVMPVNAHYKDIFLNPLLVLTGRASQGKRTNL